MEAGVSAFWTREPVFEVEFRAVRRCFAFQIKDFDFFFSTSQSKAKPKTKTSSKRSRQSIANSSTPACHFCLSLSISSRINNNVSYHPTSNIASAVMSYFKLPSYLHFWGRQTFSFTLSPCRYVCSSVKVRKPESRNEALDGANHIDYH